jgi:hypothetical protein
MEGEQMSDNDFKQGWYWVIDKKNPAIFMPCFLYIEQCNQYIQWFDTVYQVTEELLKHLRFEGPIKP